jgi:hypothetical protein
MGKKSLPRSYCGRGLSTAAGFSFSKAATRRGGSGITRTGVGLACGESTGQAASRSEGAGRADREKVCSFHDGV